MTFIENWHFYCFPKYEFNYFINRCEAFGQKPAIKVILLILIIFRHTSTEVD